MTKEQEEAIEKLTNGEKIDFNTLVRKFKREGIENFVVTKKEYIKTVLNMLKENSAEIQQKNTELAEKNAEIEYWKNGFERELEDNRKNTCELLKQDLIIKEKDSKIERLKQALARSIAKNFTSSMKESAKSKEDLEMLNKGWQIELEKKDRQINFMANFINDNISYTKDTKELENEEGIRTADFTVKYFERKSEE